MGTFFISKIKNPNPFGDILFRLYVEELGLGDYIPKIPKMSPNGFGFFFTYKKSPRKDSSPSRTMVVLLVLVYVIFNILYEKKKKSEEEARRTEEQEDAQEILLWLYALTHYGQPHNIIILVCTQYYGIHILFLYNFFI